MGGLPVRPKLEVDRAEILSAYAAGSSIDEISARYRCSNTPIRQFLLANGVALRPAVRPKALAKDRSGVIAMYRAGSSTKEIARITGVDRNTVSAFLAAEGILRKTPLRSRGFSIEAPEDKGMLAGLLLGEGSVIIRGRGAAVRIVNQDAAILGWLARFGGRIYWSKPRPSSPNPCGVWDLSRAVDVFHCLTAILSLLVGKKRSLARAALKVLAENYGLRETASPADHQATQTSHRPSGLSAAHQ